MRERGSTSVNNSQSAAADPLIALVRLLARQAAAEFAARASFAIFLVKVAGRGRHGRLFPKTHSDMISERPRISARPRHRAAHRSIASNRPPVDRQ
jgi:hypothetical protein